MKLFSAEDIEEGQYFPKAWVWRGRAMAHAKFAPTIHYLVIRIPLLAILKPGIDGKLRHHNAMMVFEHFEWKRGKGCQDRPPYIAWVPCDSIL